MDKEKIAEVLVREMEKCISSDLSRKESVEYISLILEYISDWTEEDYVGYVGN